MRKPELKDYGITDADVERLKQQQKRYENVCASARAEAEDGARTRARVALVFGIIFLIGSIVYSAVSSGCDSYTAGIGAPLWIATVVIFIVTAVLYFRGPSVAYPAKSAYVDERVENANREYEQAYRMFRDHIRHVNESLWRDSDWQSFRDRLVRLFMHEGYYEVSGGGTGRKCVSLRRGGETLLVKCAQRAEPVNYRDVEDFIGTLRHHDGYTGGVFVSPSGFADKRTSAYADRGTTVELWDMDDILEHAYGAGMLIDYDGPKPNSPVVRETYKQEAASPSTSSRSPVSPQPSRFAGSERDNGGSLEARPLDPDDDEITDDAAANATVGKWWAVGWHEGRRDPAVVGGSSAFDYRRYYRHLASDEMPDTLRRGDAHFTNSLDLYLAGCEAYGWDYWKKDGFGRRSSVYADRATEEGFGVWCPCNNNLCLDESELRGKEIQDYIYEDSIVEHVHYPDSQRLGQGIPNEIRVAFVRTKRPRESNFIYMFYGVIQCESIRYEYNGNLMIRTFRLISDTYPDDYTDLSD